jgi:hypothetical protein
VEPGETIVPAFDFATDSSAYTLSTSLNGYSTTILVTYTNHTTTTANFSNCLGGTPLELQKLTNSVWISVWSPLLLACSSPPIVVPPGQSFKTGIRVFSGFAGTNVGPQFMTVSISGTYRAIWMDVVSGSHDVPSLSLFPEPHRISNQFTLVAPPPPGD